ncbi:nucleotidyl transferase AbiEii/AbiGii toxin family protein [Microbacterium enclense]|uniref:Nucleotidyl transferase AbiEii/AbiGii toxin family protein n=1 Tax=Microbacterium enclense TaxID=993073 RepID=A0A3S3P6F7_9MICO|nr:nucleotidyl transferase AbiEii/AbiGii toxin family protein [Microbacterium enclense]RWR22005.1 nucleotidyl transferase AbiEii/AbiGii toxin family protein [Microbacterium enclense]
MAERQDGRKPRSRASRVTPGVLDEHERAVVEAQFGVAAEQVVRDHVISHALAAIATVSTDDVVFFGGTALARTHLTNLRLSEDIDLIASGSRAEIGDRIEAAIVRGLGRAFGTPTFTPRLRDTVDSESSVVEAGGVRIRLQLLSAQGYPAWPAEVVQIEQRYSDAPPARLRVLTAAAFAAAKLAAWSDRRAPRDLYDLWALADAGKIDREAVEMFGKLGPYTSAARVSFARLPTKEEWTAALGHQCVPQVEPEEAARVVRAALTPFL